jgi:hypothetical protein
MICKLCDFDGCQFYCLINKRNFFLCPGCQLIFVPDDEWISVDDEKKRYLNHHNTIDNIGYVKFLEEIAAVVSDNVKIPSRIIDFGSGQSAVLTQILRRNGYGCVPYDPNFDLKLDESGPIYDSIILCEVIEHLRDINSDLAFIKGLLKKTGSILVRTKLYPENKESFTKWWYNKDLTHINFFNLATLNFIAGKMDRTLCSSGFPDIFLFSGQSNVKV